LSSGVGPHVCTRISYTPGPTEDSAFQSLGINSVKINSCLKLLGDGLTYAVVGANILMPIAVMTGLVGGDIPR